MNTRHCHTIKFPSINNMKNYHLNVSYSMYLQTLYFFNAYHSKILIICPTTAYTMNEILLTTELFNCGAWKLLFRTVNNKRK